MRNLLAIGTVIFSLSKAGAAFDLQGLGSAQLLVDPSTTAPYTQTANSLIFSSSYELGDTLAGLFSAGSMDWSPFSKFGLRMTLTDVNPGMPFTVDFLNYEPSNPDNPYPIAKQYTGNTSVPGLGPTIIPLTLAASGTGNLSSIFALQFTWDATDSINVSVSDIVAIGGSFTALAPGGVRFITASIGDSGVRLTPGATDWSSLSDSNAKTQVTAVDHRKILREVAALPVPAWNYKHDPNRRYVGPMAQDFRAAFGLGRDDKTISTLDTDGVTLSAIKGLIEELRERRERSAEQARRLAELEAELRALNEKVRSDLPPAK
jgi:hypothetical protein